MNYNKKLNEDKKKQKELQLDAIRLITADIIIDCYVGGLSKDFILKITDFCFDEAERIAAEKNPAANHCNGDEEG